MTSVSELLHTNTQDFYTLLLEFHRPATSADRTPPATNHLSQKRILRLLLPLLLPPPQRIFVGISICAFRYSVVGRGVDAAKVESAELNVFQYGMQH